MKRYALFLVLIGIGGCSVQHEITVESTGTKIITGICDRKIFISEPDFKEWYDLHYSEYQVDTSALAEIDSLSQNVSFVVFLGTWCSDSKRVVPRFLKIIDEMKFPLNNVLLYGLDRSKKSTDGMTDKYNIHYVPTIIVVNGENELGRIVEYPQETLEKDLVGILKKW